MVHILYQLVQYTPQPIGAEQQCRAPNKGFAVQRHTRQGQHRTWMETREGLMNNLILFALRAAEQKH